MEGEREAFESFIGEKYVDGDSKKARPSQRRNCTPVYIFVTKTHFGGQRSFQSSV